MTKRFVFWLDLIILVTINKYEDANYYDCEFCSLSKQINTTPFYYKSFPSRRPVFPSCILLILVVNMGTHKVWRFAWFAHNPTYPIEQQRKKPYIIYYPQYWFWCCIHMKQFCLSSPLQLQTMCFLGLSSPLFTHVLFMRHITTCIWQSASSVLHRIELGYSRGEFPTLQLMVLVVFGAVDSALSSCMLVHVLKI